MGQDKLFDLLNEIYPEYKSLKQLVILYNKKYNMTIKDTAVSAWIIPIGSFLDSIQARDNTTNRMVRTWRIKK